jgi:hypothetical protein
VLDVAEWLDSHQIKTRHILSGTFMVSFLTFQAQFCLDQL